MKKLLFISIFIAFAALINAQTITPGMIGLQLRNAVNAKTSALSDSLLTAFDSITAQRGRIALGLLKSDTAAMLDNYTRNGELLSRLNNYLLKSDTTSMLDNYARNGEVISRLGNYLLKSDTASMLDNYTRNSELNTGLAAKQNTLVSGTNIKTINSQSLLGSGNITISGGGGGDMVYPGGSGLVTVDNGAWGTTVTNNSGNWNTAYSERLRWDGGATGLNASTGRTSLGATTVGSNIFTLPNPSAVRFLRINADNTVTALAASEYKTALSLTASDVGLGNVTNESKATMFSSPTFTGTVTLPSPFTIGATSVTTTGTQFNYLSAASGTTGTGNLVFSTSPTFTGTVTGTFSGNLTGNVTGDVSGNAGTVTGFTRNSGTLTLSGGHGLTVTTTGITGVTVPTSGTLVANPMTTAGDLIVGGASGAPTRLAATTDGYVLTLSSGAPVWAAATDASLGTRVDSIVAVLKDTMNIETLLQIDFDTDTIPSMDWVREYVADHGGGEGVTDSVNIETLLQIDLDADTLASRSWIRDYVASHGGGEGVTDSVSLAAVAPLLADVEPIFVFGLGSGQPADTIVFNNGAIAGAFFYNGEHPLKITSLTGVLAEGSGTETVGVQVSWHATFKSGSATNINATALTVNSITTGTSDTSFANDEIPSGVWVWCTLSGVSAGNRPSMLILTMSGYKIVEL